MGDKQGAPGWAGGVVISLGCAVGGALLVLAGEAAGVIAVVWCSCCSG
ncbi:hypothetical protein [Nonomuraea deserti]|nr:hypothetical protein [Nonomuraea deserti]